MGVGLRGVRGPSSVWIRSVTALPDRHSCSTKAAGRAELLDMGVLGQSTSRRSSSYPYVGCCGHPGGESSHASWRP
jgi:hypothetical protein